MSAGTCYGYAGAVQTLPPDGSVAVPLYSAVQLQRGGSLVGDASHIRAVLSHDSSAATPPETQVALAPIGKTTLSNLLHEEPTHDTGRAYFVMNLCSMASLYCAHHCIKSSFPDRTNFDTQLCYLLQLVGSAMVPAEPGGGVAQQSWQLPSSRVLWLRLDGQSSALGPVPLRDVDGVDHRSVSGVFSTMALLWCCCDVLPWLSI